MQRNFEIKITKPSSWRPPYIEENEEESEISLEFGLSKDFDADTYCYKCRGCLSAGGEIEDLFRTSSAPESEWPFGDEGIPVRLVHEMYSHSRQHEIMWRWSVNRIPPPTYDR